MSKWVKIIIWIVVIILVAWGIYSISVNNQISSDKPIKIGAILPLSGDIANWGDAARKGIDLALKEINESGGINGNNLEVIYEDDQCDKTKAVTAAQKLINVDEVEVIIGPLCSGSVLASAPTAEDAGVVILGFGSTAAISDAGDYIFRHTYSDAYQGSFLADQISNEFNIKKVDIIYVNNDYGNGLFSGFKEAFENMEGSIVNEQAYNPETLDFNTILTKIKSSDAEALVIISYGKEGGILVKRARELGIENQIFATDNFGTEEVIASGGGSVESVIFTSSVPPNEESMEVKKFEDNFIELYNEKPGILFVSASGYDAVNIVAKAIKDSSYNGKNIKNYLYSMENYKGISGDISFDEKGDATKDFMLQIIRNGKFIPYEK